MMPPDLQVRPFLLLLIVFTWNILNGVLAIANEMAGKSSENPGDSVVILTKMVKNLLFIQLSCRSE